MSTFEPALRTYGTAARAAAVLSTTRTVWQDFVARRRARRTAWLLQALSDHELKDIGLMRSDIGHLAFARSVEKAPREAHNQAADRVFGPVSDRDIARLWSGVSGSDA